MRLLFLLFMLPLLFIIGCTTQVPYICSNGSIFSNSSQCHDGVAGGGGEKSILPFQSQNGCAYNNPPCASDYHCVNNVCVKKAGCQYNNPPCDSAYDCVNKQCMKKQGCQYDNPPCDSDHRCENNQCIENTICGKFGCQLGESSANCCTDCGCPTGQTCDNNICKELRPNLVLAQTQKTKYSITMYLSKNSLPIGEVTLENNGNDDASNAVVVISSKDGYFNEKVLNFGTIPKGTKKSMQYSLDFVNQKALTLNNEVNRLTSIEYVSYTDSLNKPYTGGNTSTLEVAGKNNIVGPYQNVWDSYSPWVTPDQDIIKEFAAKSTSGLATYQSDEERKLAAKWLFESLRAYGIDYVNERVEIGDYLQYPIETLKRKNGDCEDQAILYASLLEAVGIKSAIIVIPGHVFAGYFDLDGLVVPVETTAPDFDNALQGGLEETTQHTKGKDMFIVAPGDKWGDLPQVLHAQEPSIAMMDIKKEITTNCKSLFGIFNLKGFYYSSTIRFQNNGDAPGAGCAFMITYQNGVKRSEDYECWTILAGETSDHKLENDYESGTDTTCSTR